MDYAKQEDRRLRHELLYSRQGIAAYKEHTIITLFDKTDKDWSYVWEKGLHLSDREMGKPSTFGPL